MLQIVRRRTIWEKQSGGLFRSMLHKQKLVEHRSSARDNKPKGFCTAGPHSTAVAVEAKNMPPAYFPNAPTVRKEIIFTQFAPLFSGVFFVKTKCSRFLDCIFDVRNLFVIIPVFKFWQIFLKISFSLLFRKIFV